MTGINNYWKNNMKNKINILKEIYSSLPNWKINSQKLKDKLRKEWSKF